MIDLPEEKAIYSEIQKKLLYMIPEKWESIYLYTSIIDVPKKKPLGEMYFYYIPKGILKRNPINGYEIPGIFNIDEYEYSELVTDLYNTIKKLRDSFKRNDKKVWSNLTISLKNGKFKIEYSYENLKNSEYTPYERHLIWRYKYISQEIELYSRNEKKILKKYAIENDGIEIERTDTYIENMYELPIKNIIEFERTINMEEAIARAEKEEKLEEQKELLEKKKKEAEKRKKLKKEMKIIMVRNRESKEEAKKKIEEKYMTKEEEDKNTKGNQILFGMKK